MSFIQQQHRYVVLVQDFMLTAHTALKLAKNVTTAALLTLL